MTYENENFYNEGSKFSQNSGTALSAGNEVQAFDNLQQNNLLDAAFVDNSAFAQNNQLGLLVSKVSIESMMQMVESVPLKSAYSLHLL